MRLSDYLTPDRVVLLNSATKAEALDELIDVLCGDGEAPDRQALADAVRRREEMMSTGIGNGLAIPHVRLAGLKEARMAVGVHKEGITDYESLDDKAVQIVVLIAAPQGQHETYIRLLARAADVLKRQELRRRILEADDARTVYQILTEPNV